MQLQLCYQYTPLPNAYGPTIINLTIKYVITKLNTVDRLPTMQLIVDFWKRFLVIQNFSKALRIGFISFNLSSLDKGYCRFESFRLALFKNHRYNKMRK